MLSGDLRRWPLEFGECNSRPVGRVGARIIVEQLGESVPRAIEVAILPEHVGDVKFRFREILVAVGFRRD